MQPQWQLRSLLDAARRERISRQKARWSGLFGAEIGSREPVKCPERVASRRDAWRAYFATVEEDDSVRRVAARATHRGSGG